MPRHPFLACTLAATLLVGACSSDDDDTSAATTTTETTETESTTTTTAEPAPPAPEDPGPYAVGRSTEQVVDATRDRTLTVEVWYPAASAGQPTPYELIPGVTFPSELSTVDAPASDEGPFPVVVFSHGSGGLRQQSASIVETIASHGFVVVSADHTGNTAIDQLLGTQTPFEVSARNRVLDAERLIDAVEAGELAGGIADPEQLAVAGHSFGGFTALAVAGGYEDIPADPRIDAVVPMAPASRRLSDESLSSIQVPVLIVTGTADTTTPIDDGSTRPLALVSGPAALVEVEGGTHESLTNICDILDAVSAPGAAVPDGTVETAQALAGETCDPEAPVAVEQVFDVAEHHIVAFLLAQLAGDDRYADVEPADGATVRTP